MGKIINQLCIIVGLVVCSGLQLPVHLLDLMLQIHDVGKSQRCFFAHRPHVGNLHHLRQVSDGGAIGHRDRSFITFVDARQYLEHGTFPGSVLSY